MDANRYPIEYLVPHKAPMLLINKVLTISQKSITTQVIIGDDCLLLNADKSLSASVGIEWMAQSIAAHGGYLARERGEDIIIGFLLGSRKYISERSIFKAGEQFQVSAKQLYWQDGMAAFDCQVLQEGQILVSATVNTYQPPADELTKIIGQTTNE